MPKNMRNFNPFISVLIAPSYGRNEAVVSWRIQKGYDAGDVYVYRSENGQKPWTCLNPSTPVSGRSCFTDTNFVIKDSDIRIHYRLELVLAGQSFDSPVVGVFEKLTRREFGIVRRIMQLTIKELREGRAGSECVILRPKTSGPRCRCVDPDTNQSSQGSLCPYCYGTLFEGGYLPPVKSWIQNMDWSALSRVTDPSGKGRTNDRTSEGYMLAVPEILTDDMIVLLETDTRLVVGPVKVHYFNAVIPITCAPNLTLLPRQDVRYKVPVS